MTTKLLHMIKTGKIIYHELRWILLSCVLFFLNYPLFLTMWVKFFLTQFSSNTITIISKGFNEGK